MTNSNSQENSGIYLCGNRDPDSNFDEGNSDSESVEDKSERTEYFGSSDIPAASIMGMAQSVGATLSEEVAKSLGELAMQKVRAATLLALQFSDHENAEGLRTSDFAKAEKIFNAPSFGNRSLLPELQIRPIPQANISILDRGPDIDLFATISSPKISDLRISNDIDPQFHVQQL